MRAVVVHSPGGPKAPQLTELPLPEPGPGQARVRSVAIGVGRPDALIRSGRYKWMPPLPAIPGNEIAGVVDALGPGASGVAVGDRVLLSARELPQRGGGYAEFACAPAEALYRLPDAFTFDDAVSLPNFQLAQALLFGCGAAVEPRSVLLTGAAGAVASAMVQLAPAQGLQVIATASSARKRDFVLDNGADAVLDPADPNLVAKVLDLTGGRGSISPSTPSARLCSSPACACWPPWVWRCPTTSLVARPPRTCSPNCARCRAAVSRYACSRCIPLTLIPPRRRALMGAAIGAMASGAVRAPRATVLALAQARRAHELLDAPDTVGKIILHP